MTAPTSSLPPNSEEFSATAELAGLFEDLSAPAGDPTGDAAGDVQAEPHAPLAPLSPARLLAEVRAVPPAPATVRLDAYVQECVVLEPEMLTEEFARIPADFARWNEVYALANERHLKAKLHASRTRALVAMNIRRNPRLYAQAYNLPKLTEAAVADILALDADVQTAEDLVVHAETERNRVRGVLVALGRKNDALVTIGAHQRAEMGTANGMRGGPGWVGQPLAGAPRRGNGDR